MPATVTVKDYIRADGTSPYRKFFDRLPAVAAAKVVGVIEKLGQGHKSRLEYLPGGVAEWKLDWGAGIRIYIHEDGSRLILLLGGSYNKQTQQRAIDEAREMVREYKKGQRAAAGNPSTLTPKGKSRETKA
jgi:putative addiction module killer protein